MNELQIFKNEKFGKLRTILKKGEPWWVLKDVCRVLNIANYRDAAARLDEDEKGVVITDTLGGKQKTLIISESGLYAVILQSRKPIARQFRKWITSEILPQLRKTGTYSVRTNPYFEAARLLKNCPKNKLFALKWCLEKAGVELPPLTELATTAASDKTPKTDVSVQTFLDCVADEKTLIGTRNTVVYDEYLRFCKESNVKSLCKIVFCRELCRILRFTTTPKHLNGEIYRVFCPQS
jgi:prophage antirepressor-like protein